MKILNGLTIFRKLCPVFFESQYQLTTREKVKGISSHFVTRIRRMAASSSNSMGAPPSMPLEDMLKLVRLRITTATLPHEIDSVEPFIQQMSSNESLPPNTKKQINEIKLLLDKKKAEFGSPSSQRIVIPIQDDESESSSESNSEESQTDQPEQTLGSQTEQSEEHLEAVSQLFVSQVKDPKFVLLFSRRNHYL